MGALALKKQDYFDYLEVEEAWTARLKRIAAQAEEAYRQTGNNHGPDLEWFEERYGKHSDFA